MFNFPFFFSYIKKPSLKYLVSLSTPHGIMQHTMYNLPDPDHGYATDDNARALIVAHMWKNIEETDAELMRNLETGYLRFLKFAQHENGMFYCYLSFDLHRYKLGLGDWFGRALFALSFISFKSRKFGIVAQNMLQKSLPIIFDNTFSPRTSSFIIIALYYLLKKHELTNFLRSNDLRKIQKTIKNFSVFFLELSKNCTPVWYWPENIISYDNGKLIQAYLMLGHLLENQKLHSIGMHMLDFYVNETMKRGYFQAPGNKGFWVKGKKKAYYDEQGLEAYSMTAALITAYRFTHDRNFLKLAKKVYDWYWGKNRLGVSLVDQRDGAVYDALKKNEINTNRGAESYLSLHLAYFALTKKIIL